MPLLAPHPTTEHPPPALSVEDTEQGNTEVPTKVLEGAPATRIQATARPATGSDRRLLDF